MNVVFAAFYSYVLALAKNLYEKRARLTMMKLTAGVSRPHGHSLNAFLPGLEIFLKL